MTRFRLLHAPSTPLWLATALLLLMFGLSVHSLAGKAPTMDEQGFLVRGLGYVRDENRWMRVGHPAGLNALNAMLLKDDDAVRLPVDDPSWQTTAFHRPAELFLWEIGNDVAHVMFLARLPTVWLGMVLAAIIGRFATQLAHLAHRKRTLARWSGLLALLVVALDPNILAHTRLVTTDLGLTAAVVLATYLLWRALRDPSWGRAALAGAGFGLLANTKFTAGLFVPLFALVIFIGVIAQWRAQWRAQRRFPGAMVAHLLIAYPLAAFLTLWAAYGFEIGALPQELPAFSTLLGGRTLPLAHYLDQLADIGGRMTKPTPAFLLGELSTGGWWYYFPVALLLKTPLPTLLLLALATAATLLPRKPAPAPPAALTAIDAAALLVPPLGYFAFSITTDINIGYRHILVVVPFIALIAARQLPYWMAVRGRFGRITRPLIPLCATWLVILTLWIAPHFLAYFNAFAGGPDGGYRALVDSNLDWGQDLTGLADWMTHNDADHVYLSYFGEARPDYYGIAYTGLPSFPPRLMNPQAQPLLPDDPAPGLYAISATNLQGVLFENPDLLAWFRDREPMDTIGHSIFLYDVPARGRPADLVLAGIQPVDLRAEHTALLGTNDLTYRWVDPASAIVVPDEPGGWLAGTGPLPEAVKAHYEPVVSAETITLYRDRRTAPGLTDIPGEPVNATFSDGNGGQLTLQAFAPDVSVWQQQGNNKPLALFIHAEDADGTIVTQFDGLGVAWEGWRDGDWLIQQHRLDPAAFHSGTTLRFYAGVYDPDTGVRWRTADGDRAFLGEVTVE